MRIGAVMMLLVALVLGGLSVFAARNWIETQVAGSVAVSKPQMSVVKIVVARTQLNFGDRIKDEHLSEITWPKASVPKGAFNSVRQVLDGMLRERSWGNGPAVLTNPVHIGIGTK